MNLEKENIELQIKLLETEIELYIERLKRYHNFFLVFDSYIKHNVNIIKSHKKMNPYDLKYYRNAYWEKTDPDYLLDDTYLNIKTVQNRSLLCHFLNREKSLLPPKFYFTDKNGKFKDIKKSGNKN